MSFSENDFSNLYYEFLECKSSSFFSLEKLQKTFSTNDNQISFFKMENGADDNMIVLVGNSDMSIQEKVK